MNTNRIHNLVGFFSLPADYIFAICSCMNWNTGMRADLRVVEWVRYQMGANCQHNTISIQFFSSHTRWTRHEFKKKICIEINGIICTARLEPENESWKLYRLVGFCASFLWFFCRLHTNALQFFTSFTALCLFSLNVYELLWECEHKKFFTTFAAFLIPLHSRKWSKVYFDCSVLCFTKSGENEQCNAEREMKDVCGNDLSMAKELF